MSSPSNELNRRNFLQLSTSVLAVASVPLLPGAGIGECGMTPDVVAGPFYPTRDRADEDVDLTRIDGRSDQAQGTVIRVRGRVLDASCEPVEGAVVELWQADSNGRYRHERDKQSAPIDPAFQGWGEATTGPKGQYGFKTIKPAPYPVRPDSDQFRTPHIHFRVSHADHHERVTQMFFEGESLNETDNIVQGLSEREQQQLVLSPTPNGDAAEDVYALDLALPALRTDLVSESLLERYVGGYLLDMEERAELPLQIRREGKRLYADAPPISREMELRPLSETRFDTGGFPGKELRFHPDEGPEGAVTLLLDGRMVRGRKVDASGGN